MPTDGQQVSETAKCKCGHDKEIHDWEHGCQHMAGAGPKWMCRCMDFEPAEPVAVPPAPPGIPADLLRIGGNVHHPDVCECDLWPGDGSDPECKIQPSLESVGSWIARLIERTRCAEAKLRALEGKRA